MCLCISVIKPIIESCIHIIFISKLHTPEYATARDVNRTSTKVHKLNVDSTNLVSDTTRRWLSVFVVSILWGRCGVRSESDCLRSHVSFTRETRGGGGSGAAPCTSYT